MKLIDYLKKFYGLEIKIEEIYLCLAELEERGFQGGLDYQYYFKELIDNINKEKKLLVDLGTNYRLSDVKKMVMRNKVSSKELPISLGYLTDAYNYRILNMLEALDGDDYLDYVGVLKTDISNIILKFLEHLINNPYYEDLKADLVLFKYNLIFMNVDLENDFIMNNLGASLSLKANNYRTLDLPAYKYIDRSILVLESTDYFTRIIEENEDINKSRVLIYIINVLARLILCEEDTLALIYSDLTNILEDDEINEDIKKLFQEMSTILENIKSEIVWAR